ncbi:MAG: hypothetical protein DCF32_06335 [Leptolyngbya sp.]|nr:MAG: hypothetical protein DCF32_06335 [Leptolyngbya sp.]
MSTAAACKRLGVSRWVLATARDDGQLRKGHHWKVKNPTAQRLTYLWHVDRLEKWQSDVQHAVGNNEYPADPDDMPFVALNQLVLESYVSNLAVEADRPD